jgi:glycosyltransferase involved in cell wall biosynthesis
MRIAHVVTLVSATGSFGGPVSVARGQAVELARRGHDVALYAGWYGEGTVDTAGTDLDVRLFRARRTVPGAGFSGLTAPGLVAALASGDHELVHVHLGRDLITMSAARACRGTSLPYVVQTHGMVGPDRRTKARILDVVASRRVLRSAGSLLALNPAEAVALRDVTSGAASIELLGNGVSSSASLSDSGRTPVRNGTSVPDVLFCARLHPRKRVVAFVEMAADLVQRGSRARFSIVGPDEGDLVPMRAAITALGLSERVFYEGPLAAADVAGRLARADVFVLPSVDEPFAMTILEALSLGVPTVVTDTCRIADDLRSRGAALVTDGSPRCLAEAVERVLCDSSTARSLARAAQLAVQEQYSIGAVVDRLEAIYGRVAGNLMSSA